MARQNYSKNTDSRQKSNSTNRSGKRSRRSSKYKNDKREVSDSIPESGGPNSPDWYAKNAQILIDSASLPYSNHLGTVSKLGANTNFRSPGLFTTYYAPTIGYSTDGSSAINIAANNFYSWIRHANSGHANYDAPDLMLYLLAMDSIHSFHYFLARVYGIMRAYSYFNRYYPKTIIQSMSIDFDDLEEKLSDFRYYINQFAIKAASFAIPAGMTYMERHKWMYSGIYLDSMSVRAQTYCMNPFSFLKYNEFDGAGKLDHIMWDTQHETEIFGRHLRTLEEIQAFGNSLLAAVQMSEDCNIMSGDILKAYSSDKITKSFQLPEDYLVTPQYNPEVLSQIQNTTVLPTEELVLESLDVTQLSNGVLYQAVHYESNKALNEVYKLYDTSRVLSMYKDVVTPADNMVSTRCMVIPTYHEANEKTQLQITACGSDICIASQISTMPVEIAEAHSVKPLTQAPAYIESTGGAVGTSRAVAMCAIYSRFNNHPATWITETTPSTDNGSGSIFFDVDNYTIVNKNDLQKMHDTALLSQFSAPLVTFMM